MEILSQRVEAGLLELAWSLWTELGVAGVRRKHQQSAIDLEALILLTASLSELDPRLRDEALDWCSRYHHFVSVRRLKTLVKWVDVKSFSGFAATLNAASDSKWPVPELADSFDVKLSGKSQEPQCERPALITLRLRALFGSGSRADLISYFLMHEKKEFSTSDLTTVGYSKRNTADVLNALVSSGVLQTRSVRNQRIYCLRDKAQMIKWIGALPHTFPNWIPSLKVLMKLREVLRKVDQKQESVRVTTISSAMRKLGGELQELGLEFPKSTGNISTYWKVIEEWISKVTEELLSQTS